MADEFAGFDTTDIEIEQYDDDHVPDVESPRVNFNKMKIELNGVGQAVIGDEVDAYRYWVVKCLLTERDRYLAYSSDFGIEFEEIAAADYPRDIAESELQRTITEALMVDVRTVSVNDFQFEWKGDRVFITFLVESIYNIEVYEMSRGGEKDGYIGISAA